MAFEKFTLIRDYNWGVYPYIDIMRRIEAIMLESGDNKLAEQATKALEAVFRVYQQAVANVPDSFWEDRA